ncbi:MAG: hypothetical protein HGB17_15020 [Syntrophobacteraceae bacterium]|nr:hypothetical protein [Syntrophobacteraceae bacterium]
MVPRRIRGPWLAVRGYLLLLRKRGGSLYELRAYRKAESFPGRAERAVAAQQEGPGQPDVLLRAAADPATPRHARRAVRNLPLLPGCDAGDEDAAGQGHPLHDHSGRGRHRRVRAADGLDARRGVRRGALVLALPAQKWNGSLQNALGSLSLAKDWGQTHLDHVCAVASQKGLLTMDELKSYYRCLRYNLRQAEQKGLSLFFHLLHELREVPNVPDMEVFSPLASVA